MKGRIKMPAVKKTKNDTAGKYEYYRQSLTIDGKRITIRGKTKAEFEAKLETAQRKKRQGLIGGDISVREWTARWLAVYTANLSATQQAHYKAKIEHDLIPYIGGRKIASVKASDLQEILNAYAGGKKGTVEKIRQAFRLIFADAAYERIIDHDPAVRLKLPKLAESPRRPLTETERKAVLAVAETHPRGAYVLTMLYCGLRRGECLALTSGDVDLEGQRITVSKALVLNGNVGELGGTKAAKMRKGAESDPSVGVRTVPIPDKLLPVLRPLCANKAPETILFPKGDGTHATQQTVVWWWRSFTRACHIEAGATLYRNAVQYDASPFGAEVTPHYLRHTYATDIYAAGVDEMARKIFLGHANHDVTAGYTAMSEEAFARNANLINTYLEKELWVKNGSNKNSGTV
jgi:integrase